MSTEFRMLGPVEALSRGAGCLLGGAEAARAAGESAAARAAVVSARPAHRRAVGRPTRPARRRSHFRSTSTGSAPRARRRPDRDARHRLPSSGSSPGELDVDALRAAGRAGRAGARSDARRCRRRPAGGSRSCGRGRHWPISPASPWPKQAAPRLEDRGSVRWSCATTLSSRWASRRTLPGARAADRRGAVQGTAARQYVLALYRAGRQKDALEAYRRATEVSWTELGVEPGPELQELERADPAPRRRRSQRPRAPGPGARRAAGAADAAPRAPARGRRGRLRCSAATTSGS